MKLASFLLIVAFHVSATGVSQITLSEKNAPLEKVFNAIEKQSGYVFFYDYAWLDGAKKVTFQVKNVSLTEALNKCFKDQPLTYSIIGKTIVVKQTIAVGKIRNVEIAIPAIPPPRIITGTITDEEGKPLVGVSVTVKGTTIGTSSNTEGRYSVEVPENGTLIFSYVGFVTKEVPVNNRSEIDVEMEENVSALDQIVVVGYGTQKKENLTGAVAQISGKTLENRSVTDISQALQGHMANLNIASSNGGAPGSIPTINIRGYSGLGTATAPLVVIDGVQGGDLNSININDVESVTVLKDAASAAIYGSSAPYGVILIQTKQGNKNGEPLISYNNNFGFVQPINLPKTMNSLDFANLMNEASDNSGIAHRVPDEQLDRIKDFLAGRITEETVVNPTPGSDGWLGGNANHDWFKILFKDFAFNQQHNISLSGGTSKSKYYVGLGYLKQEGIYKGMNNSFERFNIRANLSTELTKYLTFNLRSAFSRGNTIELNQTGRSYIDALGNIMHQIARMKPWDPVIYPNGSKNLVFELFEDGGKSRRRADRVMLTGEFAIHPGVKGWDVTVNYTYDGIYNNTGDHIRTLMNNTLPSGTPRVWVGAPNSMSRTNVTNQHFIVNAFSSYEKQLSDHYLKVLLGYTQEMYDDLTFTGSNTFLYTDNIPSLSLTYGPNASVTDVGSQLAIRGEFGRINYNFREKYLLELNGRYDGTSRFLKDVRNKFYPGVSIAWVLSKEQGWKSFKSVIPFFKLRGSYGKLGDQSFTSNRYPFHPSLVTTAPTSTNYIFASGLSSTVSNPSLINPDLTWITVSNLDFGADLTFLSNKLSLSFDWYRRFQNDYVGPAEALPAFLGTAAPLANSAALRTNGFDVTVGWQDRKDKLSYNITTVLSDYQSVVTKYPNPNNLITTWYVGQHVGDIWGYETIGLFQSKEEITESPSQEILYSRWVPGDVRYADLNHDGKIDFGDNTLDNPGDRRVIGNTTPRFSFGINAYIQYGAFDLSLFFQGVGKRDAAPSPTSHVSNYFWGVTGDAVQSTGFIQQYDRWSLDNPDGYYPNFYFTIPEMNKNKQTQTRYLLNASYLRIKNLQVGYSLKKGLLDKIGFSRARFFVSVENLATITSYIKTMDPEFSNTEGFALGPDGKVYPLQRTWALGLNVTF